MHEINKESLYVYRAQLCRVIDGDTFDFDIDVGFETHLFKRIRLLDVDTYELRGGTVETKQKANEAKAYAQSAFDTAKSIYISTIMDGEGKYGRVLAHVIIETHNDTYYSLGDALIAEGLVENKTE